MDRPSSPIPGPPRGRPDLTRPPALPSSSLTRRALLAGVAGTVAAGTLSRGLPAWARVIPGPAGRAAGVRKPDSLPFPGRPAGTPSMPEIDHIVVLMMENHTFDNLLGMVAYQVPGRSGTDGLTVHHGRVINSNPGPNGRVRASRAASPCQLPHLPTQAWNASHQAYDRGRNDGFVRASGPIAMRYWDERDLPFTYSLVRHFPFGERYFSSVLAQTYPNRRFFFTGTASGTTATDNTTFNIPAANGTIFDRFDAHRISWRIYYQQVVSALIVKGFYTPARRRKFLKMASFYADAAAGRLPAFSFIDPQYGTTSEENPQDIQVGERFIASVVRALMRSPQWHRTALFITYDEGGGYYDHVPPPKAIKPDAIAPIPVPGNVPGAYDRYGFRVPAIVVSPWARSGYVSRVVQDHTSILAFLERKWNLPAMTYRDANAAPMTDYFDFTGRPAFLTPPSVHAAPGLKLGLEECKAQGLNPPLP